MKDLFEIRATRRGVISVVVTLTMIAQMAGCAGPRVIHEPYSDHVGDSVLVTTRAGHIHKGVLMDADSMRIGLIQGESGGRVFEQIAVDSVLRAESLSDRNPGVMPLVWVLTFCAGVFAIGVLLGLALWDY